MNRFIIIALMFCASLSKAQVCSSAPASVSELEAFFHGEKDISFLGRFKVQLLEQKCDVNSQDCTEWLVSQNVLQITDEMKNSGGQECKGCYYFEGPLDVSKIKNLSNYVAISNYIQDYWRSFSVSHTEISLIKKQQTFEVKINFYGETNPQMPNFVPKNLEAHVPINKDIVSYGIYTHENLKADYTLHRVSKTHGLFDEDTISNHRSIQSQLQAFGYPSLKRLGVARVNIHKDRCLDIMSTVTSEFNLDVKKITNYKMEFLNIL